MKFIPTRFIITSCRLQMCNSKSRAFTLIANKRGTSGVFRRNLIKNTEYTNLTMARFKTILNNLDTQSQIRRSQKNLTEKLVKCLEELMNTEYSNLTVAEASSSKEENFKNLLLQVGEKRINFTEEDKKRIGNILYDVLNPPNLEVVTIDSLATKEEVLPSLPTKEEVLPSLPTKEELVECLQDMIEYIEYIDPTVVRGKSSLDLIPEVGRKQKDFAEKFVKCIEELKNTDFSKWGVAYASHAMVASFVCLLFEVGMKRINFTEVEKRQIGNLLVDVFEPIQRNVEFTRNLGSDKHMVTLLVRRSVLQFLVEDFGQFPARSSTLKNELEKAEIEASMGFLDITMEYWWDPADPSEDTDLEDVRPLDVPDTHTWWEDEYLYVFSDSDEDSHREKAAPRTPAPVGLPNIHGWWF